MTPAAQTLRRTRRELDESPGIAAYLADWEELRLGLPPSEPAFVKALRRAAIERFAAFGFPSSRQEEWRFTNVAPIARASFRRPGPRAAAPLADLEHLLHLPSIVPQIPAEQLGSWTFDAAARLVFVDGRFAPELSTSLPAERTDCSIDPAALTSIGSIGSIGPIGAEVVVGSLAAALDRTPELLEQHLGRHAGFADHPFVALNTAFLRDGALVVLPRGLVLERPIHLLFLSSPAAGSPSAATVSYPRNLFVMGEGSQATIVESYAGAGSYLTCAVTELVAGPGSVVDHYKVQRESRDAFHMATFQVHGGRNSSISSHSISLGGGLVRNDVNAVLAGEGIDCILNGLYLADGRQHVDNHMRVEHAQPHCASHELYKGILDGKARSVFNGLIHVNPGAQKTDAKQSNRNLLLSSEAIANSNPQLEIFADDVKCTHGSTVGQLDDDAIFYLRSRGIGEEAARSLLTYAFASDIVERIKVEPVRRDLEEFLFSRLPKGEVVRQAV